MKRHLSSLTMALMLVVTLLVGCGSGSGPSTSPVVTGATPSVSGTPLSFTVTPQTTATLTSAQGLQLATVGGAGASFAPNQVALDTLVTLTQHDAPLQQPRDTATKLTGPAATLEFATQVPTGTFQVTLPHTITDAQGTFMGFFVNGIFVPVETAVDASGNRVVGQVDLAVLKAFGPKSKASVAVTFAVAEGVSLLPPHVFWNSYNVYHYTNGAFTKIVSLGQPLGAIPDLGSKPAVIVHGFGSSIRKQEFNALAASLLSQGTATGVIGFEYDTLDSIANNGKYLDQALSQYAAVHGVQKWHVVAHSMGGLVSRVFLEQTTHAGLATTGNRLVTLCTPNTGSPVANKLTSKLSLFQQFFRYVVLNAMMDFTNADGKRSQVPLNAPGIVDLQVGNAYLGVLNTNPDQNHDEATYYAVGGTALDLQYAVLDIIVGVDTDDGLVLLPSAIYLSLCLSDAKALLVDHSSAVSSSLSFSAVATFLTEPINPICVQQIP